MRWPKLTRAHIPRRRSGTHSDPDVELGYSTDATKLPTVRGSSVTEHRKTANEAPNVQHLPPAVPDPAPVSNDQTYDLKPKFCATTSVRACEEAHDPPSTNLTRHSRLHDDITSNRRSNKTCSRQHNRSTARHLWIASIMSRIPCGIRFEAYKALFSIVLVANTAIFITLAIGQEGHRLDAEKTLQAVGANIFAAVLIRQEFMVNLLFELCTRVPLRTPFAIRKFLADVHHFGGVHSGSATSGVAWYIAYAYFATRRFTAAENGKRALEIVDLTACLIVLVFLIAIVVTTLPWLRRKHHNVFERTHRFAGWAAILALWIHTIIGALGDNQKVYKQPSLYLLALTTLLLILPWLRIRRIPVEVEEMSDRQVMLLFSYDDMPPMSTMRFSLQPLLEWHAFATIPASHASPPSQQQLQASGSSKTKRRSASIIVAKAGDWTEQIIRNTPKYIYMRDLPTFNFLKGVRMFERVLLIATGAGIGPILSLLDSISPAPAPSSSSASPTSVSSPTTPLSSTAETTLPFPATNLLATEKVRCPHHRNFKIIWTAQESSAPYWAFAVQKIRHIDPEALIFDSNQGRRDLVSEALKVVAEEKTEAAFVVGSQGITRRIEGGLAARGVPVYGAVFDS